MNERYDMWLREVARIYGQEAAYGEKKVDALTILAMELRDGVEYRTGRKLNNIEMLQRRCAAMSMVANTMISGWYSSNALTKNQVKDIEGSDVIDGTVKRPSWRESELDVGKEFPDYDPQKSFKDGVEVPYGTKGSTRPESYKSGHSIEVKNYNVETSGGRNNLVNNVSKQVDSRIQNLPSGTKQTVIIDVRGQTVSNEILKGIRTNILNKAVIEIEIIFKR